MGYSRSTMLWLFFSTAFLCVILGCGDGSESEGPFRTLKGRVVNGEGNPVPNVSVILPELLEVTVTDETGRFQINTDLLEDPVQVLLEQSEFSVTFFIHDVPSQTKSVDVNVSIRSSESGVIPVIEGIEFQ